MPRGSWFNSWACPTIPETGQQGRVPHPPSFEWAGPAHRWRIVDSAGDVIAKGYESQEAAEAALASHGKPEAA